MQIIEMHKRSHNISHFLYPFVSHPQEDLVVYPLNACINAQCLVGRGVLTPPPLCYEDKPYIAYPLFFTFCPPSPLPSIHTHTLLFLLSCFFGWMGNCATFDVLFYLIVLWIYTYWALVPCTRRTLMCVLCNKASSLVRSDT